MKWVRAAIVSAPSVKNGSSMRRVFHVRKKDVLIAEVNCFAKDLITMSS
jgi:hypothetical protein